MPERRKSGGTLGVTLADVARRAQTSTAVVSYVINNGPRPVAASTRERVLQAIAELGYRPDRVARALRAKRSGVIGVLLPDTANPFFASLGQAIEAAAFDAGRLVVVGNARFDPDREEAYVHAFLDSRAEGLVVVSTRHSPRAVDALASAPVPAVYVHHAPPGTPSAAVLADNDGGGQLATTHLLDHGHESVAVLAGPDDAGPVGGRVAGWQRALAEHGVPDDRRIESRGALTRAGGHAGMRRLLEHEDRPTAVFAVTDELAVGALHAIAEAGLRVPGDIALVGFDGVPEAEFTNPSMTTIGVPAERMARSAIASLDRAWQGQERPGGTEILPVSLIRRASCGCGSPMPR
ncbi:LacI family DNA-binding transcriptional regulator [Actinoallomurus sp. CA-150999]|uniref:LacI family DNA-binding transcriptional regulator n=1 Tax=Actinoallomurus sp. CA-150999 TaxID=3239887 RepID=UPI003D93012A